MQNKEHKIKFSERLRELMIQRGYGSRNATSGASPAALSKAIGCFTEMALRYLDGRAIPNLEIIVKISDWLKVDPGYLLFGERCLINPDNQNKMMIDKGLFDYALRKIKPLFISSHDDVSIDFFVSILNDLSKMDLDTEQLKMVFDLALKSSIFFEKGTGPEIKEYDNPKLPCQLTS